MSTRLQTNTNQVVERDFDVRLKRDRSWPYGTRVIAVDQHGNEATLVSFTRNGKLTRQKDVYLSGIITDDNGRIALEE